MIVEYTVINTDNPLQTFDFLDYDKAKLKVEALRLQGKRVIVTGIDENGNEREIDMQLWHLQKCERCFYLASK